MDTLEFIVQPEEKVFRQKSNAASQAVLLVLGGIGLIGFAVVGFIIAVLSSRSNPVSLQLTTTLPTLIGLGAIYSGRMAARTPKEVGVGPEGVRLVNRDGTKLLTWNDIGWSKVETLAQSNKKLLHLYNTSGVAIIKLSDSLDGFDAMVTEVASYIAAKPDQTAGRIKSAKARKSAVTLLLGGIGFLSLAAAVAFMTNQQIRGARLLAETGISGVGQIERRFIAPNGVTCRLEYSVTNSAGKTGSRNAEVDRDTWESLANAQTVPVRYVPDDPGVSKLASGEVEKNDPFKEPLIGYGLPAVIAAMSLCFIISGALTLKGWNIDLNSKTGKLSIKRPGGSA